MNTKKLKINIPEGYEIDRENSTFEEIVFKKKVDHFSRLPKTWEEYCEYAKDCPSYYGNPRQTNICETRFDGFYNEFFTKERVKQYVALGKLLQLRDYWVSNWKDDSNNSVAVIYHFEGEIVNINVSKKRSLSYSLTFPTREMAKEFRNCFEDLIKEAYPLV